MDEQGCKTRAVPSPFPLKLTEVRNDLIQTCVGGLFVKAVTLKNDKLIMWQVVFQRSARLTDAVIDSSPQE